MLNCLVMVLNCVFPLLLNWVVVSCILIAFLGLLVSFVGFPLRDLMPLMLCFELVCYLVYFCGWSDFVNSLVYDC